MTVNLTRIYTRLGDDGATHLGDMSRVPKTDARIEAYGTIDELNAQIGVTRGVEGLPAEQEQWLARVQNDLFDLGADLSLPEEKDGPHYRIKSKHEHHERIAHERDLMPTAAAQKSVFS